jgi:beta-lactam-binding protein with PASTA domain
MKKHWILWNLSGALLFVVAVVIGISVGLNRITRHGKTVVAPDFTNMSLAEAARAASEGKVGIKVTDSVFVKGLEGGIVYRQSPRAGATVKQGRSIFLTINSIVPRKVVMPNLVGYSLSEAKAELHNRGLDLGRLRYVRDIATNQVLHQSLDGRDVAPGEMVVSGSAIELTLGLSSEGATTTVPRLIGMKYIRAVDALHDKSLNVGRVRCDGQIRSYADSTQAMVWKQDAPGAVKTLGSSVDIYLTLDPAKIPAQ